MTSPVLAVQQPDGSRMYVHPVTGEKVPAVSTVLGVINKPALVGWAARMAAQYANDNWERLSETPEGQRVEEIKIAHRVSAEKKADLGDLVHELIDCWARGVPFPKVRKEANSYVDRFIDFMTVKRPSFVENEVTVWSRKHGYAGTADWIAVIDGKLLLGDNKGLALDTPLPTPDGWTTMGAVREGDRLMDGYGRPCRVVEKSQIHLKPCYRVRFDDGSEVICDFDHRWAVETGPYRKRTREILTAQQMTGRIFGRYGGRDLRVPVAGSLDLPEQDLPIHPYVLGCWLGDGKHTNGEISKPDDFLFEEIARCGYEVGPDISSDGRCQARTVYGLRSSLGSLGLLGHKHIPDAYLRASHTQRLALLQGLMDSDGCWNRRRNDAVFVNTNKALVFATRELILSLGQRVNCHEYTARGFGKEVTAWRVTFTPNDVNPFRLPRKAEQVTEASVRASRRIVVSVEPTVTVRTQCVAVDSPDHTYLCGESMIPTHNTGRRVYPEVGLQLSALAGADFIIRPDGEECEIPHFDGLAALHIRPRSWKLMPVDGQDESFAAFIAARKLLQWQNEIAPRILLEA